MEKAIGRRVNSQLHEINLGYVKAFLIETSNNNLILVDTGIPGNSKDKIIKYVTSLNKSVTDIKYILLTHAHLDHFGNAYDLQKITGAHLGISQAGIPYVNGEQGVLYPIGHNFKSKMFVNLIKMMAKFSKPKYVKPDMILKEGEFPDDFGVKARILETPGHTFDSISIFLEESKTVLVGDLLTGDKNGLRLPDFYDDYIKLLDSVKKIKDLNADLICVSHGIDYPPERIKV